MVIFNNYEFRPSTNGPQPLSQIKGSEPLTGRKPLSGTASEFKDVEHDCKAIDEESVSLKIALRITGFITRMNLAGSFTCATKRGRTCYTTKTPSPLKKQVCICHKGHTMITPNLQSDLIQSTTEKWLVKKEISPLSKELLQHTLGLDEAGSRFVEEHLNTSPIKVQRLLCHKQKAAIGHDQIDLLTNITIEESPQSNQFDARCERAMRPKEDVASKNCTDGVLCAEDAVVQLVFENVTFLEKSVQELEERLQLAQTYSEEYQKVAFFLQSPLQSEFAQIISSIKILLELKDRLLLRKPGAPRFTKVSDYRHDYFWLNTLVKTYDKSPELAWATFELTFPTSAKPSVSSSQIEQDLKDYALFLQEAKLQLKYTRLYAGQEKIHALNKFYFGPLQTNQHVTPSKDDVKKTFVEMAKKITPAKRKLSFS